MSRNIDISLQCYIKRDDKYLMLHRATHKRIMPDVWMAPGGRREFNEGLFECARREVKEETGLEINNLRIKATGGVYMEDIDLEIYPHLLVADYAGGKLVTSMEDGAFRWLSAEEIYLLPDLLGEVRPLVSHLFGNSDEVVSYKATYKKGNEMTHYLIEEN